MRKQKIFPDLKKSKTAALLYDQPLTTMKSMIYSNNGTNSLKTTDMEPIRQVCDFYAHIFIIINARTRK